MKLKALLPKTPKEFLLPPKLTSLIINYALTFFAFITISVLMTLILKPLLNIVILLYLMLTIWYIGYALILLAKLLNKAVGIKLPSKINTTLKKTNEENSKLEKAVNTIIRKPGEKILFYDASKYCEERMIRTYQSGHAGLKLMKGVWVGGSQGYSTSSPELTELDTGVIIVTNQKVIFKGTTRNTQVELKKINILEPYKDGLLIGIEERQKSMFFETQTPLAMEHTIRTQIQNNTPESEKFAYLELAVKIKDSLDIQLNLDETLTKEQIEKLETQQQYLESSLHKYKNIPQVNKINKLNELSQALKHLIEELKEDNKTKIQKTNEKIAKIMEEINN